MKTACVLRWGAFGDLVIASPVFAQLKSEGYHVTANVISRGEPVIRHNPNIDKIVVYEDGTIAHDKLDEYWAELSKGFDRFINLTGSIENGLLASERNDASYHLSHEERHAKFNYNYYDRTMEIAGYPELKGKTGELYFTSVEHEWARSFRKKFKNKFLILWSLSGSSFHKAYPWAEYVAEGMQNIHPDLNIVTIGDDICRFLEWEHAQTRCMSGVLLIRKSMILTQYADLVISTETGILNAAGCFDTPKIALLSHSSEENLTKYFRNCINLHADVECYPCHRLIYTQNACRLERVSQAPVCMGNLKASALVEAIEKYYQSWRNDGSLLRDKRETVFCG